MLSREELLHHYPSRYEDLRNYERGVVDGARNIYTRSGKTVQKILVRIGKETRELTFFNQPFLVKTLRPGVNVSLAGNEYEVNGPLIHTGRLVPVYPETKGISSKWLRRQIYNQLKKPVDDWLPENIITQYHLIDLNSALQKIHFPKNQTEIDVATKRLAFDEMLKLQLKALETKNQWQEKKLAHRLVIDQEKISRLISRLPFKLTASQNKSLAEIFSDLGSGRPMNRLLQGEVGSGKTVVAAAAMYAAHLNGLTAVLMAPTEILANQHFQTLQAVFANLPVKIQLVTSSTKSKIYDLKSNIYVGTHALLFKKLGQLGLLVIDEQHRFGVKQRSRLLQTKISPHLLSMTATPIPRTVALTVYAHLDLSTLADLPHKKTVKTWVVPQNKRLSAYQWIDKQIAAGQTQVFIVCPLIEASAKESMKDIKNVTEEFSRLRTIFPGRKLDLIHGRLKSKDKNKIITAFAKNQTDILVATPVIEVGIDIPQAAIMVVENAERFGLAQLHQLRGRVGRRDQIGYCLLFSQTNAPRLKTLESVSQGVKLAELDLKFRGPGEIYGLAQHGFLKLKLASLTDLELITLTGQAAAAIIASCRHNQNAKSPAVGGANAAPALN